MNYSNKSILVIGSCIIWLCLFIIPFYKLAILSINSESHTHILMIPFVSVYIIWLNRKRIFKETTEARNLGIIVVAASLLIYLVGFLLRNHIAPNDYLSFTTLSGIIFFYGIFVGFAGVRAFKSAAFSLLFLLFMVPIPLFILDSFIKFLQVDSAKMAGAVFRAIGIPAFRNGTVISLSGVSIEVAKECSGIRSTLVLIILTVLIGYMYLNSNWRRLALVVAIVPISIFKNALRIVLLASLGNYVDISWLTNSALHREGGIPFLFLALFMLWPIVWVFRRWEGVGGKVQESGSDRLSAIGGERK